MFCFGISACLLATGVVADVPRDDLAEVRIAATDPLVEEAREFVTDQKVKQTVEKLIARRGIVASELPEPAQVPAGEIDLQMEEGRVQAGEKRAFLAKWSLQVGDSIDGHYTYHVFLANYRGGKYRGGAGTWGIATTQLNGQQHSVTAEWTQPAQGRHRVLAILAAWSIKTERLHIVAVEEQVEPAAESK